MDYKTINTIIVDNNINFKNILLKYDIVLFDFMGVVSDGNNTIKGSNEVLEFLKTNNKIVSFISNAPLLSSGMEKELIKYNIYKNKHYDFALTSGEVSNKIMNSGLLKLDNEKELKNCYIFGKVSDENLLKNTQYNIVDNVESADFIYIGYPQLNLKEYNLSNYKQYLYESCMFKDQYFDSTIIDVFIDKIKLFKKYNLPMFSDCSDKIAMQMDKNTKKINYVIRQGSITDEYKKIGGKVIDISKPSSVIFDFVFNTIQMAYNINIKNKKIIMIGDTIETDILGANNTTNNLNIKVDSMLTLSGVTAKYFNYNVSKIINNIINNKINLNYIIDSLGVILN